MTNIHTLNSFRDNFDPVLGQYVTERLDHAELVLGSSYNDLPFLNHLMPLVGQGGKRIRPYIAYLMFKSCEGKGDSYIKPALLALELLHSFCLIHDDIIDHGRERHGSPTIHTFTQNHLEKRGAANARHTAESQAILAGDLVFAWAEKAISPYASVSPAVQDAYHAIAEEVILGQMLDVDITTRQSTSLNAINQKMLLKTARYSFVGPLTIGALLVGRKDTKTLHFCTQFGTHLGLAFQTQDDMLDLTAYATHKTKGSDLATHQHTLLTQHFYKHASDKVKHQLEHLIQQNRMPVASIQNLFQESGTLLYAQEEVMKHVDRAKQALLKAPISSDYKNKWQEFIAFLVNRTY